jgi:hypothetical protein
VETAAEAWGSAGSGTIRYKAKAVTEYDVDDDDTDAPIGPQPPRMNAARARA